MKRNKMNIRLHEVRDPRNICWVLPMKSKGEDLLGYYTNRTAYDYEYCIFEVYESNLMLEEKISYRECIASLIYEDLLNE